jgi:hypothetical protein
MPGMSSERTTGEMTPAKFVAKWSPVTLPERAASQEHFLDLCRLLGQPTPAEIDATGAEYTFEKGVAVTDSASRGSSGAGGFADAWWRGKFAWEYKRKGKYRDLAEAYRQLCQYREDLENPPLLIVSDIARIEIHTNFTGFKPIVHTIPLAHLGQPDNLALLRRVFTDPLSFRPNITTEQVTQDVAKQIASIATMFQQAGHEPHAAAHFLMKCMFCLFAEDVDLLPDKLFSRLLKQWHDQPAELTARLTELFEKMRTGGAFGTERIAWFNGGLFDTSPALPLDHGQIGLLRIAAAQDWGSVEPAIFGTLFERSLDPTKRAQIGAHYTSRDDIMLIVEPVVMAPLRKEWQDVRQQVEDQIQRRRDAKPNPKKIKADKTITKGDEVINSLLQGFLDRLAAVRVLDPACGSGNFLYVAIQQLLNLEKEVINFGARADIGLPLFPTVRPTQLHGIEMNPYAAELAQMVIWIGYLQWMRDNGFNVPRDPILQPLQSIECRDAILDLSDPKNPAPAKWPEADFIIGNPPFLGASRIRDGLGGAYAECLFNTFREAIPGFSDLCCYWFELARRSIEQRPTTRAGLLATQGIRGSDNRTVLERIKESGGIFMAWSDRDWVLDGAAVHVSMVGFDNGEQCERILNGSIVASINPDLTTGAHIGDASALPENIGIQHEGDKKGGAFEIDWRLARTLLTKPCVGGSSPCDVLRPWFNGKEMNDRKLGMWIIDFPPGMSIVQAAGYESAFQIIEDKIRPKYGSTRSSWWVHERPRPELRAAMKALSRTVVTTRHSKHRMFAWEPTIALPDSAVIVFARSDDYFFGVLHSSIHELWARRMGTQLREAESGFRYTPTTCFETFPLPWPPGKEPAGDPLYRRIAAVAKELDAMRERWLNPPEWIEPIAAAVDAADDFADVPAEARGLIRQSAIMAAAAKDPNLKKRTLTNLYNQRPTWLKLAHAELDRSVLAAYAAQDAAGGWREDWAEVWLDTGAGQALPDGHPLTARRTEIDQKVLANLLRLNQGR